MGREPLKTLAGFIGGSLIFAGCAIGQPSGSVSNDGHDPRLQEFLALPPEARSGEKGRLLWNEYVAGVEYETENGGRRVIDVPPPPAEPPRVYREAIRRDGWIERFPDLVEAETWWSGNVAGTSQVVVTVGLRPERNDDGSYVAGVDQETVLIAQIDGWPESSPIHFTYQVPLDQSLGRLHIDRREGKFLILSSESGATIRIDVDALAVALLAESEDAVQATITVDE